MKEKIKFYRMHQEMKSNLVLFFSTLLIFIIMVLSIFTFEKLKDESCMNIKREIALCNFMATNNTQKKICLNKIIEKYGSRNFSKCSN